MHTVLISTFHSNTNLDYFMLQSHVNDFLQKHIHLTLFLLQFSTGHMTTLLTVDKSIDKMASLCCYLQKWCKMLNLEAMWKWITFRGIGVCRNKRHKLISLLDWKQLYIPHDSIKTSAHHSWIFLWNAFFYHGCLDVLVIYLAVKHDHRNPSQKLGEQEI